MHLMSMLYEIKEIFLTMKIFLKYLLNVAIQLNVECCEAL